MASGSGSGSGSAPASGSRLGAYSLEDAPWVEKYRPRTLDDVAAHREIVDTSASLLQRGLDGIFAGP